MLAHVHMVSSPVSNVDAVPYILVGIPSAERTGCHELTHPQVNNNRQQLTKFLERLRLRCHSAGRHEKAQCEYDASEKCRHACRTQINTRLTNERRRTKRANCGTSHHLEGERDTPQHTSWDEKIVGWRNSQGCGNGFLFV